MIIVMYKGWQKLFLIAIFLLFAWSLFLRFNQFGKVPTGLYWDEQAILLDAKSVAQTGLDMHGRPWYQVIYPSYGDYKLPVYIWFASFSVKLLGATETAVRLPSAIAGLVTIVVAGFLVKDLLTAEDKTFASKGNELGVAEIAGILASLTIALSPWSILFSRTGFESNLAQCLLVISVWCMVRANKKINFIFLAPLLGILATYTYFSVRFVWLGVFILLSILFLPNWKTFQKNKRSAIAAVFFRVALPLIIFAVGLLPMLHSPLYEASNTFRLSTDSVLQNTSDVLQSNVYREMAGNQKIDRVIFYRWWLTGRKLLSNYSDNLSLNFLFISGDPNLRHGTTQHGLYLIIFLPFFIGGWYVLLRRYPKVFVLFLAWWILALLPASVPNTTPHALRSLNALLPLSAVIGIGMAVAFTKVRSWKLPFSFIVPGLVILILFLSLFQFSLFYFEEYPILSSASWQGGYKQLAQTAFELRKNNEDVYVVSFDDRFYLWLLAYGPYSVQNIQTFPHANFQIRDFDGVYTEHMPSTLSKNAIILGSIDQVEQFVKKNNYSVVNSKKILQPNQVPLEAANVMMNITHEK